MKEQLILLVSDAYKEALDLQGQKAGFVKPGQINKDTPIHGNGGYLDSLGLLDLILALEEKVKSRFKIFISLSEIKAASENENPFKNVEVLSLCLKELLEKKGITLNDD